MSKLLFSIKLFHQYYDNGNWQDVSLVPDQQTQTILVRYELIARLEQGNYSIYYLGTEKLNEFGASMQALFNQQPLVFSIRADAQHFTLISDIPLNWLDWLGLLKYSSRDIDERSADASLLVPSLAKSNALQQGEVGEISIHPADLFDPRGERVNTNFEIKIEARKTPWNYYIINVSNIKLVDPKISGRDGIEFDAPTRVSIDGNDNVLLFSSGVRRFTMSETAKHTFDLLNTVKPLEAPGITGSSASKRLVKGLPTPSTNEISILTNAGQDYACSQMYVYL